MLCKACQQKGSYQMLMFFVSLYNPLALCYPACKDNSGGVMHSAHESVRAMFQAPVMQ